MITVQGFIDGVPYGVNVGSTRADPDDGITAGSPNALSVLRAYEGEQVLATPTGPELTLNLDDPESVIAALMEHSDEAKVTATSPDELPDWLNVDPDVVY